MLVRFLLLLAAATALLHATDAATQPTVQLPTGATISGIVESNVQGNLVNKYLGIPYTDAPVGDKRWKQSTVKDLAQDLNATAYGDVCHGNPASDAASGQFPNNEDCLYLNVFTPAGATSKDKLPVMVWVHGGGFVAGAGNPYDGGSLIGVSGQKVIVVNFNYRLGALGFFSNEEILAEGDGANFGLRDQETAFLWVKKYISSFGGDPNDITAFGESAGAISLAHHLLAHDGTQTLFKRAILQSGGYPSVQGMPTKAVQAQQTARLAAAVGCADAPDGVLTCLRTVPARAIFDASQSFNHFPTIDQVFISRAPFPSILAGKVSRVPTIIGATTDDGWYFSFAGADASQFDAFLRSTYPAMTEAERARLQELYPAAAFSSSHARASEIRGDEIFACAGAIFSNVLSVTERDTYRYRFNQPSMKLGTPLALHADDLDYVFDRRYNLDNSTGGAAVVRHMQTYWTNFAVTGSPNGIQHDGPTQGGKSTFWPRYDVGTMQQIVLQPTLATEADSVRAARCAFWYKLETRLAPGFDN